MINAIQDETGADITIEDDGTIYVGASDGPSAQAAVDRINAIANPQLPKVGERFLGTVVKTAPFGPSSPCSRAATACAHQQARLAASASARSRTS
jgi:polyribonucleotide nucleotidyltransferase